MRTWSNTPQFQPMDSTDSGAATYLVEAKAWVYDANRVDERFSIHQLADGLLRSVGGLSRRRGSSCDGWLICILVLRLLLLKKTKAATSTLHGRSFGELRDNGVLVSHTGVVGKLRLG